MKNIKLKTNLLKNNLSAEQAEPFIQKIAKWDGLRTNIIGEYNLAFSKFRFLILICQQNDLQYWVNKDLREANHIYEKSLDFSLVNEQYDMTQYLN